MLREFFKSQRYQKLLSKIVLQKVDISEQTREVARNDTDDQFKEVNFEELQSVIDELNEWHPNEVPLELNPGRL